MRFSCGALSFMWEVLMGVYLVEIIFSYEIFLVSFVYNFSCERVSCEEILSFLSLPYGSFLAGVSFLWKFLMEALFHMIIFLKGSISSLWEFHLQASLFVLSGSCREISLTYESFFCGGRGSFLWDFLMWDFFYEPAIHTVPHRVITLSHPLRRNSKPQFIDDEGRVEKKSPSDAYCENRLRKSSFSWSWIKLAPKIVLSWILRGNRHFHYLGGNWPRKSSVSWILEKISSGNRHFPGFGEHRLRRSSFSWIWRKSAPKIVSMLGVLSYHLDHSIRWYILRLHEIHTYVLYCLITTVYGGISVHIYFEVRSAFAHAFVFFERL